MRWPGQVQKKMHTGLWRKEKLKTGDLEDLDVGGKALFNSS